MFCACKYLVVRYSRPLYIYMGHLECRNLQYIYNIFSDELENLYREHVHIVYSGRPLVMEYKEEVH